MRAQFELFLIAVSVFTRLPVPAWWISRGQAGRAVRFSAAGRLVDRAGGGGGVVAGRAGAAGRSGGGAVDGGDRPPDRRPARDGWADTCDGLGGGWTTQQALAIMKDSRIGSYGAIGLVLMLLAKYLALTDLGADEVTGDRHAARRHPLSRLVAVGPDGDSITRAPTPAPNPRRWPDGPTPPNWASRPSPACCRCCCCHPPKPLALALAACVAVGVLARRDFVRRLGGLHQRLPWAPPAARRTIDLPRNPLAAWALPDPHPGPTWRRASAAATPTSGWPNPPKPSPPPATAARRAGSPFASPLMRAPALLAEAHSAPRLDPRSAQKSTSADGRGAAHADIGQAALDVRPTRRSTPPARRQIAAPDGRRRTPFCAELQAAPPGDDGGRRHRRPAARWPANSSACRRRRWLGLSSRCGEVSPRPPTTGARCCAGLVPLTRRDRQQRVPFRRLAPLSAPASVIPALRVRHFVGNYPKTIIVVEFGGLTIKMSICSFGRRRPPVCGRFHADDVADSAQEDFTVATRRTLLQTGSAGAIPPLSPWASAAR